MARPRCAICGAPAVVYLRYARMALCREHFREHLLRRVEGVLRRAGLLRRGARIVTAVSGGKDSSTLLDLLAELSRRYGLQVYPLHIDLGIGEYSAHLRRAVERLVSRLGLPLILVEVRRVLRGDGVPEFARRAGRPTCSVCGMVKRYVMNAAAEALGADAIATGHNADDAIAYIVKAFIGRDEEQMAKWLPYTPPSGGAVARVRPLYEVYERYALLYAIVNRIPFTHEECPYRARNSMEDTIKEMFNRLEEQHPGLKIGFLRRFSKRRGAGGVPGPVNRCRICGAPSQGEVCSFCRLTERVYGEPLGPEMKRAVAEAVEKALGVSSGSGGGRASAPPQGPS